MVVYGWTRATEIERILSQIDDLFFVFTDNFFLRDDYCDEDDDDDVDFYEAIEQ